MEQQDKYINICNNNKLYKINENIIKDYIIKMLNFNNTLFITMTFNNDNIINKTHKEREQMIINYLNNNTLDYILNCDYGTLTNREHYHAIATIKYKPNNNPLEPYNKDNGINFKEYHKIGGIKANFIRTKTSKEHNQNLNNEKIANRFIIHATQETTKSSILIIKNTII